MDVFFYVLLTSIQKDEILFYLKYMEVLALLKSKVLSETLEFEQKCNVNIFFLYHKILNKTLNYFLVLGLM